MANIAVNALVVDTLIVDTLIRDLLEWLARRYRGYAEVIEASRTSCPKLPTREQANDRGLLESEEADGGCVIRVSAAGRALLERNRLSRTAEREIAGRSLSIWCFVRSTTSCWIELHLR